MKIFKQITAVLVIISLVLSLSGCDIVGEARKTQAILREDGETIVYKNTEYKLLEQSNNLSPLATDYNNIIHLTDPDTPILLSFFVGEEYMMSNDNIFIFSLYDDEIEYFCRSDKYDEISEKANGKVAYDSYCYTYYALDEETLEYTEQRVKLTESQRNAVQTVLAESEAELIPESAELSYDYLVEVYACSEDFMFMKHYADIVRTESEHFIITYDEDNSYSYKAEITESQILSKIVDETIDEFDEYY